MATEDLETSRITLKPIEDSDYPTLHRWRNESRFLALFSAKREVVSPENFTKELAREFERNRHLQFIVLRKKDVVALGTIFSFNFNHIDGYIFVNVYIDENYENRGYGAEAIVVIVRYLFKFLPIHKICFEVFEYNCLSLSTMRNAVSSYGFCEEGCFKEHRFFDGKYYDVFRFAILRDSLDKIESLLQKFKSRGQPLT
ncbi:MAG: GNAT family protein [bacterium]|nr:GNAT family protein [bacterium]